MATEDQLIIAQVEDLILPKIDIPTIVESFYHELQSRLQNSGESMLPSGVLGIQTKNFDDFVTDTIHLAIDFGGSKLKIAILKINSSKSIKILFQDDCDITEKVVNYAFFEKIIDWICQRLFSNNFITSDIELLISTTFSFPLDSQNRIVTMGKGFVLSEELRELGMTEILHKSFEKILRKFSSDKRFKFKICDIVNDSVAVFLTNFFYSSNNESNISLILGTGINSCFSIPQTSLPSKKKLSDSKAGSQIKNLDVIINGEIGFLGGDIIALTDFDNKADDSTLNMPLEFVTSGKYVPIAFQQTLTHYKLLNLSDGLTINGETFCRFVHGQTTAYVDEKYSDLAKQIALIYIKRSSIYITSLLLAIQKLLENFGNNPKTINVGYVGSYLNQCPELRRQIETISNYKIKLNHLNNSNLIGAAVSTHMKHLSNCI